MNQREAGISTPLSAWWSHSMFFDCVTFWFKAVKRCFRCIIL